MTREARHSGSRVSARHQVGGRTRCDGGTGGTIWHGGIEFADLSLGTSDGRDVGRGFCGNIAPSYPHGWMGLARARDNRLKVMMTIRVKQMASELNR